MSGLYIGVGLSLAAGSSLEVHLPLCSGPGWLALAVSLLMNHGKQVR